METYAAEINEALQKYGRCILPGIGLLEVIYHQAERSFNDNTLQPPAFKLILSHGYNQKDKTGSVIDEIILSHSFTEEEALKEWEITRDAIKEKLSTGSSVPLEGLGWFSLDEEGNITLVSALKTSLFYQPVYLKSPQDPTPVAAKDSTSSAESDIVSELPPKEEKTFSFHTRQSKARWWIIGSILALIIISWFTYQGTKVRRREKATIKEILTQKPKGDPTVRLDSIKQTIDSMETARKIANDSINYKIIFATYDNRRKAEHQFHKMRGWGHPVELITKDSTHYELAWPFTSLPIDTVVNLVKMMKLYGKDVHIEYDNK